MITLMINDNYFLTSPIILSLMPRPHFYDGEFTVSAPVFIQFNDMWSGSWRDVINCWLLSDGDFKLNSYTLTQNCVCVCMCVWPPVQTRTASASPWSSVITALYRRDS